MSAGTRVVLLEHRARKLSEETFTAQQERAKGLETLGRFHDTVLRSFSEGVMPQHPFAIEYAQRMAERAVALVTEKRRFVEESDDRGEARLRNESERAAEESATHLRTFFQTARLPIQGTRLSTTLVDDHRRLRLAPVAR